MADRGWEGAKGREGEWVQGSGEHKVPIRVLWPSSEEVPTISLHLLVCALSKISKSLISLMGGF